MSTARAKTYATWLQAAWRWGVYFALVLAVICCTIGCERSSAQPEDAEESMEGEDVNDHRYVTWDRFEVDRWTAAWLIKRFVDKEATFVTVPFGSSISENEGTPFDVPGASWMRTPQASTSGVIRQKIEEEDQRLDWILSLVRDLELSAWRLDPDAPAWKFQERLHGRYSEAPVEHQQRIELMFEYLDQVYAQGRVDTKVSENPQPRGGDCHE